MRTRTASFAVAYLKLKPNWVAVFLFDKSGNPTCNQNVSASVVKHSVHEGIRKASVVWVGGRHGSLARCYRITKLGAVAPSIVSRIGHHSAERMGVGVQGSALSYGLAA